MYKAFDSFLSTETWHTGHGFDDQRFYEALQQVVADPKFNAEAMGDYMRAKMGVAADDDDGAFAKAIRRRTQDAWAVRDYLKYTKGIDD